MKVHDIVTVRVEKDSPLLYFILLREDLEQCGWYAVDQKGEIFFLFYGIIRYEATRDWHLGVRRDKTSRDWHVIIEDHTKGFQFLTASDPEMYAAMGKVLSFAAKGLWKGRSRTRSACGCGGMSGLPSLDYYDRLKDPGNPIYFLHPKRRQ